MFLMEISDQEGDNPLRFHFSKEITYKVNFHVPSMFPPAFMPFPVCPALHNEETVKINVEKGYQSLKTRNEPEKQISGQICGD